MITKLYPNQFEEPEKAIDVALEKLDIEYIDMDFPCAFAMAAIVSSPNSSAVCPLPPSGYQVLA